MTGVQTCALPIFAVFDPEFQRSDSFGRRSAQKAIHNYFFLKGLDALLAGVLFLLGIYAAGWQVMLKKFNLGVAYANRAAVVIWGILLAWLCLGEALSWTLAAGAALVIGGIILVSTEEAHE